jgi:hypothetical protein
MMRLRAFNRSIYSIFAQDDWQVSDQLEHGRRRPR